MSEIDEDEMIVFQTLADRAMVTEPAYVIPKLAEAVHKLLAELKATRNNRLIAAIFGAHKGAPRPFALYRHQDETGASGTGLVATGSVFDDGVTVIRWRGERPSTVVWSSIEDAERVHGHGGKTQIVWLSEDLGTLAEMEQQRDDALRMVLALTGTDPCQLDHHGNCQEHGWVDGQCPKVRAEALLAAEGKDTDA